MKFYPHNADECCKANDARMEKAEGDLGEPAVLLLLDICEKGLPDCYDSFNSFLWDFYPGHLSWTGKEIDKEINHILSSPRFPEIKAGILRDWNFDMEENLRKLLEFDPNNC